jgi:hypothetical protein
MESAQGSQWGRARGHDPSARHRRVLGARCGGRVLTDVRREAGFTDVDRVAVTPDFAVYAAR